MCRGVSKVKTVPVPAIPVLEEPRVYPYPCGTLVSPELQSVDLKPYITKGFPAHVLEERLRYITEVKLVYWELVVKERKVACIARV